MTSAGDPNWVILQKNVQGSLIDKIGKHFDEDEWRLTHGPAMRDVQVRRGRELKEKLPARTIVLARITEEVVAEVETSVRPIEMPERLS